MTKKVLIIKTGSTLPSLSKKYGDFEDWILTGMMIPRTEALVCEAFKGAELPDSEQINAAVITGSHDMVTDHQPWSERTARWLAGAVEKELAILGICYGHQLLAYALGGSVANNPKGREAGVIPIYLKNSAINDPLLDGLPNPFWAPAHHSQSVIILPPGARLLASSSKDAHQAFVLKKSVYGVQFHPEFDAEILAAYLEHDRRRANASNSALPIEKVQQDHDLNANAEILRRFARLIKR